MLADRVRIGIKKGEIEGRFPNYSKQGQVSTDNIVIEDDITLHVSITKLISNTSLPISTWTVNRTARKEFHDSLKYNEGNRIRFFNKGDTIGLRFTSYFADSNILVVLRENDENGKVWASFEVSITSY